MNDMLISMGVSALIMIARDKQGRGKWRKALLKVFREIAVAFRDDSDFQAVVKEVQK